MLGGGAVQRLIPATQSSLAHGRASSSVLMDFVSEEMRTISDRGRQELLFADDVIKTLAVRPCANAEQLAESLSMNVRTLLRRANSSFGYGTSVLARLLRLQRFLAISSTSGCLAPASGLGALAIDAGYSDQAHLRRESRAISGRTPGQFLRMYVPSFPDMSDPFNTTQRFDVSGTFENGTAIAKLVVVSVTNELKGATGSGSFKADPAGSVRLDLTI